MELEIKASYTEDLIDQLDKVIVRQQEQIDLLIKAMVKAMQLAEADFRPYRSVATIAPQPVQVAA